MALKYEEYWATIRAMPKREQMMVVHMTLVNIPRDMIEEYMAMAPDDLVELLDLPEPPDLK